MKVRPIHYLLLFSGAALIRLALFSVGVNNVLGQRVEIVTPVTSFKRLVEGLYLFQIGLSPYAGTVFHQAPLLLPLLSPFLAPSVPPIFLHLLFIGIDLLIGIALYGVAKNYVKDDSPVKSSSESSSSQTSLVEESWFSEHPYALVALYLFNPFSIASCVGMSTILFTNLAIVCCAYYSLKGNPPLATFFLALASYLSFNPIALLIPVSIILKKHTKKRVPLLHVVTLLLFSLFLGGLLYLSFVLTGSWEFLRKTYGFVLLVEDATPNIGLFWYYFVEIFIHFKKFFLFAFQFHPFIYIAPLTFRLNNHPLFLFWTLLAISSTFKAYPALGDFVIPLATLPIFHKILYRLSYPLVVSVVMVVVVVLAPVIWHMWLYTGGGNANFYYALTLVFTLAQVLLISDAASSVVKRDYLLKHNITLDDNGLVMSPPLSSPPPSK